MNPPNPIAFRRTVASLFLLASVSVGGALAKDDAIRGFLEQHCAECHDSTEKKGDLDFAALPSDFTSPEYFSRWVKVHDRIESGEMPPRKRKRPPETERAGAVKWLHDSLAAAERAQQKDGRTGIRRMTRAEYENTVRDLFEMPGIALAGELPPDVSAHGFDKNSDALDISHVNLAKYIEAADRTLDLAIATQPQAPAVQKARSRSATGRFRRARRHERRRCAAPRQKARPGISACGRTGQPSRRRRA